MTILNQLYSVCPDCAQPQNTYTSLLLDAMFRCQCSNDALIESSHTGVMVAFFLKPSEAQQLALPGGESVDDLHCTLCFMGDRDDIKDMDRLKQVVSGYAQSASALQGTTSGIGMFTPSDSSDGLAPIVSLVNISGLQDFRRALVDALEQEGYQIAKNFDYVPHITRMYSNPSNTIPINDMDNISLNFDTLWLAIGDDRYAFPLNRSNNNAQQQSKETGQEASLQDLAQSKESREAHARDAGSKHSNEAYREDTSRSQGRQWRAVTTEQDALEKQASLLITKFLKSGKISDKSFIVSQDTQDKLTQDLAQILQQAHGLGAQHGSAMVGRQNEAASIKSIGTNIAYFLKRAKDIVSGIVTRISNVVSDVVSKGGDASDAKEVVDHMMDYVPDQTSVTAVHDEVEHGVDDVFDEESVEFIEWICEPNACGVCLDNQSAGAIKRNEAFPSGHKRPIAHFNCRCNIAPSEGQ